MKQKKLLIAGLSLNKLADLLISAKTTLTALLVSVGAPVWMIGWLVPIRESGALLPQVLISIYLRKHAQRHIVWRIGMITQVFSVVGMLLSVILFSGFIAGILVLASLVLLSLGRSACSLTVKDMEADVAKKGERGNLIGVASTVSGVVTLVIAIPLVIYDGALTSNILLVVLCASMLAFILTLICVWPIKTRVEVESSSENTFSINFDTTIYKFIFVRGLFVHSALVAPYFMIERNGDVKELLPIYIGAEATAALLSSIIWGKIADKSAKLTLRLSGLLALGACVGLLFWQTSSIVTSALLFFVLSVAHAGVRTGRKTYSLDVKEGHDRTELVGFSNTAIGIILLAFGALYAALAPALSFSVVYIMAGMLLLAVATTVILPDEK
ncbi:permease of the major facilitator superfamily protein [Alteromonas macleodii str. 'Black Sea 11']|nr:permease of the major facilitator superfamily protein [Alteromonas macleodii str. 'Black Sea 11']NKW89256.1 MFS transporter [Alteromonadaceae bacterium A_SAG4]NKX05323.1 MFS transporter [Alteromonadaceae bacterium A_SAG6]NKX18265.1 MFS transporter [Alteromonadaceae bacterium A_SAG5]NKX19742.1 MFS transporter [Alteromonadaceae bacterium A_SAG8]NKX68525.1 MFS transporter [Alteromonadaceae bacterium A_SAG7]